MRLIAIVHYSTLINSTSRLSPCCHRSPPASPTADSAGRREGRSTRGPPCRRIWPARGKDTSRRHALSSPPSLRRHPAPSYFLSNLSAASPAADQAV
ncbi:hypothetical protein DAI22_02g111000 [Oryza sativa Japonica Group]|nr:hypothetical protein DAI22_02g111000 [Oryza sativa Japonica Group]KAF2944045.1 hypothetical protein DAI22_02g111000 [Oryza sativa Japonica Group]